LLLDKQHCVVRDTIMVEEVTGNQHRIDGLGYSPIHNGLQAMAIQGTVRLALFGTPIAVTVEMNVCSMENLQGAPGVWSHVLFALGKICQTFVWDWQPVSQELTGLSSVRYLPGRFGCGFFTCLTRSSTPSPMPEPLWIYLTAMGQYSVNQVVTCGLEAWHPD
jgi:hypothetical protein